MKTRNLKFDLEDLYSRKYDSKMDVLEINKEAQIVW